jgi:hypothetical protein
MYMRPRKRKNSSCSYTIVRGSHRVFQSDHVRFPALTQYFALRGTSSLEKDPVTRNQRGNAVRWRTSSNGLSFLCLKGILALLHPILPLNMGGKPSIDKGCGEFLSLLEGVCRLAVYEETHRIAEPLVFSRMSNVQVGVSFECVFEDEEMERPGQAELIYERKVLLSLAA